MSDATDNAWEQLTAAPGDSALFRRLLESLCAASDWAGLVRLYRRRAEVVPAAEAVLLHLTIAERWGRDLGDRDTIDGAYAAALASAGGDTASREALRELFWKRGRWPLLAELLRQDVERAKPGDERAAAWLELARFLTVKVSDLPAAADALRAAFRESPDTGPACREELENLRRLHPEEAAFGSVLIEIYRDRGESGPLYELLSEQRERLGDELPDQAIGLFTLELDLARLAGRDLGHWEAAVDHLRHAAELDPERSKAVRRTASELGRLYPDQPDLLAFVEETSRAEGDWVGTLEALNTRLEAETDPASRARLHLETAEVLIARLGRTHQGLSELQNALSHDPKLVEPVSRRYRQALEADDSAAVSPELEERLTVGLLEARSLDELLALQLARLTRARQPAERAALQVQIADLRCGLGQTAEALADYRQAAELAEAGPVLDHVFGGLFRLLASPGITAETEALIEELARRTERWDDALRLLAARLERATEPAERAALHGALGQLLSGPLDQAEAAAGHFLEAAELAPRDREHQMRARHGLRRAGRAREAADRFALEWPLCDSAETRSVLVEETAEVIADDLEDPLGAIALAVEYLGEGAGWERVREGLRRALAGPVGAERVEALLATGEVEGRFGRRVADVLRHLYLSPADGTLAGSGGDALLALDRHSPLPADLEAPLERSLAEAGRHTERAELLERRADRSSDPGRRQQALEALLATYREELDDTEGAVHVFWRLLADSPDDFERIASFGDLLSETGQTEELVRLHDAVIARVDTASAPPGFADLLRRHAKLQATDLGRPDLAAVTWRRLLRVDPVDPEAVSVLRDRYASAEDAEALYEALAEGVDRIAESTSRAARHNELAALAMERLKDPDRARQHWDAVLREAEDVPEAARQAVAAWRALAAAQEDDAALLALARIEQGLLDEDTRRARLPELFDRVEALGDHPEARAALEELAEADLDDVGLLERGADAALQCDFAQREADFVRQMVALDPRPEHRLRLARILADELDAPDEALDLTRALLAERPGDVILVRLAESLMVGLELHGALVALLADQVERAPDDAARLDLLRRLSDHADPDLSGDRDLRAWALGEIVRIDPSEVDAALRLARHHEDAGRWNEALAAMRIGLERHEDAAARAELLRRIGSVSEHEVDDLDQARQAYQQLAELTPDDPGAVRAQLRIAEKQSDDAAIVSLSARLQALEPHAADVAELVERALALVDGADGDADQAIALLEGRIARDPLDQASLQRLAALLEAAERWTELSAALDRMAGLAGSDRERIELWMRRAAVLEERVGDPETAGHVYQDVLQMHGGNRLALNALKRIHATLERWSGVLTVLSRLAQLESDTRVRAAIFREMAEVEEARLEQPAEAMALHQQAHELLVDETASLAAMRRLAEAHDLWEPYVEALRHDARRSGSPDEQGARLAECADVLERELEAPERAFTLLFERFDLTPRDEELFAQLRALALRGELWDELESLYKRRARTRLEPSDQAAMLQELADLILSEARDPERSLRVLNDAYARRPGDSETLARMEALAAEHGLWESLDAIYGSLYEEASQVSRKVALLLQRAELLEERLALPDSAFEQLVMALQLDPRSDEVVAALERSAERHERWTTLAKLYELLAKERPENALRVRFLQAEARVARDRLGDLDRTFDVIARAWRIDPSNDKLRDELAEAAEAAERLDRLAEAYSWEAVNRVDPADRVAALERLAALCRDRLDDLPRAVHALSEAFKVDPERSETLAGLRQMLLERQESALLLGVLTRWVPAARTGAQQRALFLTMAEVAESADRVQEAIEAWRGVLAIDPRDLEALSGLARLHRKVGDWDRVVHCLEQSLRVVQEPDRKADLYIELADLFVQLGRLERAATIYEGRIASFPEREWPTAELVETYLRLDDAEAAVAHLERVGQSGDETHASDALLLAAELAALKLDDPRRGIRLSKRAARLTPESARAWRLTADMATLAERWQDRVEALSALAELPPPADGQLSAEHVIALREALTTSHEALGEALLNLPPSSASALYLGLAARTLEDRLFYPDRALGIWQEAVARAEGWPLPELEVARLADQLGQTAVAEASLRRAAALLERLELRFAMSRVWTKLADGIAADPQRIVHAISAYEAGITADPANDSAYGKYEALLHQSGRLERGRQFFEELLASGLQGGRRRAALVLQARALDAVGDSLAASRVLEEAHGLGRDDPAVNRALADLAFDRGDFDRALDLYAGLVEQVALGPDTRPEAATGRDTTLMKRLASAAERTGQLDLAQEQYAEVHGHDPSDPEALLGLGRLALRRGAAALAEDYLDKARAQLSSEPEPVAALTVPVQAQAQLLEGDIVATRGDRRAAVALWEPLADRPGAAGRQARERLVEGYTQLTRYSEAVAVLRRLAADAPPGGARVELLLRRATLARERLDDPEQAWRATSEAMRLAEGDAAIRDQALELAVAVGRWDEASKMAEAALSDQTEPAAVARIRLLAGAAAAGQGKLPSARAHYSAAVRLDPFNPKAIEGLIDAATQQRDWTRLRQELNAALERVGGRRPAVRGLILRALGDVLSGMLLDRQGALEVYSELAELYPDDVEVHRKRLELYRKATPVDGPGAVATIQRLARLGVLDTDGLRFLQRWYHQSGRPDGAFVMTELLAVCGEATPTERQLLREHALPHPPAGLAAGLAEEVARYGLRGVETAPLVVSHLATAAVAVAERDAPPDGPSHHLEPAFRELADALGRANARLLWGHGGFGTTLINCRDVTVLLDPDGFNGLTEAQQRFEIGARGWLCQAEAVMAAVLNEFEYVTFHEAALDPIRQADDGFEVDESLASQVRAWHAVFGWEQAGPPAVPEADRVSRESLPTPLAWREQCQRTAWRIGLLYADSLPASLAGLVDREPALSGRSLRSVDALQQAMAASDGVRELVAYALSEAYLEARERLGLACLEFDPTAVLTDELTDGDPLRDKAVAAFELEIEEGAVEE